MYLESQELMESYADTLACLKEKFSEKNAQLKASFTQNDSMKEELEQTQKEKDVLSEKFAVFKDHMVGILESVQTRLANYNDKDQAYQGLLEENKTLKHKYEDMLVRYTELSHGS